jgi:hypothetical protein
MLESLIKTALNIVSDSWACLLPVENLLAAEILSNRHNLEVCLYGLLLMSHNLS